MVNGVIGGGTVGGGVPVDPGAVNGTTSKLAVGDLVPSADLTINAAGVSQAAVQLKSKDQGMILDIREGTALLDADGKALTNVLAAKLEAVSAPPPDRAVILAYNFGPDGAKFDPPLTLTLNFGVASLPSNIDLNSLQLVFWNGSSWVEISCQVDLTGQTITAQISHFSHYALISSYLPPSAVPTTPPLTTSAGLFTEKPTPEATPVVTNSIPAVVTSTTQASPDALAITEPVVSQTKAPIPVSQAEIPLSMLILIYTAVFVVSAITTILLRLRRARSGS